MAEEEPTDESENEPVTIVKMPGEARNSGARNADIDDAARADTLEEREARLIAASGLAADIVHEENRYAETSLLGEGGMGRIFLCNDGRVGRDVAMKVLRRRYGKHPDTLARFVREARVQGQLEHPSIVPVYDLTRRPDGDVCFTMKRVRGKTIEQIVDGLNAKDKAFVEDYPRRKLLRTFATACMAVDFAHTRGVLHRDLKPANVMLGDHAEVYVLDWGLSKVSGLPDIPHPSDLVTVPEDGGTKTLDGAVLGTPGYMAPEQARGRAATMDARSDVYALGAILYEMLALQPMHARGSVSGMMNSTVAGVDGRPSFRSPTRSIPSELDAICVKATQLDPEHRFASAREIHDAIERYLDGEQDLKLMREMAQAHARAAEVASEYALAGGPNAKEERVRALREVGRALALDPSHGEANRTLLKLLAEPPRELPPEERVYVEAEGDLEGTLTLNMASYMHLSFIPATLLILWMGVKSVPSLAMYCIIATGAALLGFLTQRESVPASWRLFGNVISSTLVVGFMSTMFGPLFLIPGLAAMTSTLSAFNTQTRSARYMIMSIGMLAVLVPLLLEYVGLLPPSYQFRGDSLVIMPRMHWFPETATLFFLCYIALGHIITITLLVGRMHEARAAAIEKLHMTTWQLKQLVSDDSRPATGKVKLGH